MTDKWTAFIAARLDDDERWLRVILGAAERNEASGDTVSLVAAALSDPQVRAEVARWAGAPVRPPNDVRSALRVVEFGRKLLAEHSPRASEYGGTGFKPGEPSCTACGVDDGWWGVAWPCPTVRDFAGIWSGHPDYPQEEEQA